MYEVLYYIHKVNNIFVSFASICVFSLLFSPFYSVILDSPQFCELSELVAAGHKLSHQATHIIDTIADAKMKCNTQNSTSSSSLNNTNENDAENQVEVEVEIVQVEKELSDLERVQKIQSGFSEWSQLTHGLRSQIPPLLTQIHEQRLSQNENISGTFTVIFLISSSIISFVPSQHFSLRPFLRLGIFSCYFCSIHTGRVHCHS